MPGDISYNAVKAYLMLHTLATCNGSDYAPVDLDQIARITECSRDTAMASVNELCAAGWIHEVSPGIVYGPFPHEEPRVKPVLDYGPDWPRIRDLILERDGHQCQACGSTVDLVVHHIWPLRDWGTHDPENLVTLCPTCHHRTHRQLGR